MDINRPCGVIISDFTADALAGLLRNDGQFPPVSATIAPFGQVTQLLLDPSAGCWQPRPDFAVVWTRPQGIVSSFSSLLDGEAVALEQLLAQVDAFADLLLDAARRVEYLFVPTWTLPASERGLGLIDLRRSPGSIGVARALLEMNLRLAQRLDPREATQVQAQEAASPERQADNVFLLDASRWTGSAGRYAAPTKLWLMGKVAFGHEVLKEASADIKAGLCGVAGRSRKLVIVDLDDTLWGGIVGEVGWENVVCGGHDAVGEALVEFQRGLKALARNGVLLGIVSKNDEATGLAVLRNHPEMVLRPDDFAGWRINWEDKAANIEALVTELNLGLDATVFIDDNPTERDRVRQALPQVAVPEWPTDKMAYPDALRALRCFDKPAITAEDGSRQQMYLEERRRGEALQSTLASSATLDEWLSTLALTVTARVLDSGDLKRAAQLLNKTNQMNLASRRMSEADFLHWSRQPGRRVLVFYVSDRFGDAGLTGIASVEVDEASSEALARGAELADFLLSCRVMGRGVEEAMLSAAVEVARSAGVANLTARVAPTERNNPCLRFYRERSGFVAGDVEGTFVWHTGREYPIPAHVRLELA